jgi:hypothetical protein
VLQRSDLTVQANDSMIELFYENKHRANIRKASMKSDEWEVIFSVSTKITMKKNKYVLIAIAFVTLSLRVYSQDDKDTQKYRLILSELTNSRCDYMICDCDESYVNQIIEHDSLKKSKYNSYILPYPLSPIEPWSDI